MAEIKVQARLSRQASFFVIVERGDDFGVRLPMSAGSEMTIDNSHSFSASANKPDLPFLQNSRGVPFEGTSRDLAVGVKEDGGRPELVMTESDGSVPGRIKCRNTCDFPVDVQIRIGGDKFLSEVRVGAGETVLVDTANDRLRFTPVFYPPTPVDSVTSSKPDAHAWIFGSYDEGFRMEVE